MGNRFGFKDLVIVGLLLVALVSIWLQMRQADMQTEQMNGIREELAVTARVQTDLLKETGETQALIDDFLAAIRDITSEDAAQTQPAATQASEPDPPATQASAWPSRGYARRVLAMAANRVVAERRRFADRDPFARLKAAREMEGFAEGDRMVDAFTAQPARLTPLISQDWYGSRIQSYVLESLAALDPDTLEYAPLLAQSWEASDDGLTYTFKIRRGVTYSDGHEMKADDFVHQWEMIQDPAYDAARSRNLLSGILQAVEAPDDYTLVFRFKEPYYRAFLVAAAWEPLPRHFYGKGRFSPEVYNENPGILMGTGPYRMRTPDGWTPGDPLLLVRNERYWGTPPAFDSLMFRVIQNQYAQTIELKNGTIDMVYRMLPEPYIELMKDLKPTDGIEGYEFDLVTGGYGFIAWNQQRDGKPTVFADARVRRAMTMLINRDRMIEEVLHGKAKVVSGPFNPLSKQYNHDIEPYPFSIPNAKALLAEAGWEDTDGDGVLDKDGKPFVFTHTYPGGGTFWPRVLRMFQADMADAGVVMKLDALEWSVFSERQDSGQFDSICMAWGAGLESDIHQMFHSSSIGNGADNWMGYVNPQLDALIDEARRTTDEPERMAMWREAHRILHEDQPYTFLYTRNGLAAIDSRIKNVQIVRLGISDRTEWFAPYAIQKY